MRADPTGAVELGQAMGREGDAERLWTKLIEGNAVLTGRLGIGKTTLLRLALADAPTGWSGQLAALDRARTGAEACAAVVDAFVSEAGPEAGSEAGPEAGPEAGSEAGPEAGPEAAAEAASAMRLAIEAGLARSSAGMVLVLDDFDRWLKEAGKSGAGGLAEFTGTLAQLCVEQPKLRLVFVSNTHLDRTLARLRSEPLMALVEGCARVEVEALGPEAGARLAMALLLGESITAKDRAAFGRSLAHTCDHVPRWIHCAVASLAKRGKPFVDSDLERCMVEAVSDLDRAPWALRRELAPALDDYQQPQRGLAFSVLDQLALAEDPSMTFNDLRRHLAMEATIDDDAIERVLEQLHGDQLVRESGGQLRFAGELLRAAWLKLRYL